MKLYVEPMDPRSSRSSRRPRAPRERRLAEPTLQERRAIIYAARGEIAALTELVEILERDATARPA